MSKSQYTIGIDLGTTNCTCAFIENEKGEGDLKSPPKVEQFHIPQIMKAGVLGESASLPSFLYFPLEQELEKGIAVFPNAQEEHCVGLFAKERGSELPSRMISSAKSWLCHDAVDRRSSFLPLDSEEKSMSPVQVCSEYLTLIKRAWDEKYPHALFDEQNVLVTVPASFDPSARQLVQEAAQNAKFPEIVLLEEPQAAFYSWLNQHHDSWRKQLDLGDRVLVVDIGGGTTDFSLIEVTENDGDLALERRIVGSHLLLGGDNMDLSLAYCIKAKFEEKGHEIDEWQLRALVHSARDAKELLLSEDAPSEVEINVQGRGSSLIGGSLTESLSFEDVKQMVLEGFFPLISSEEKSLDERVSGIRQLGLPYAKDPRVTAQLALFLHSLSNKEGASTFVMPSAVIFNGGVMKSSLIQKRLLEQLKVWAKAHGKDDVKLLKEPNFDFAVSQGAAVYGLARQGKAIRIKSGMSKSYYIGVEEAIPAIPGMEPPVKALLLVPFGMEEGSEVDLPDQEFSLSLGQPVNFRFFQETPTLDGKKALEPGTVVRNWKKNLNELHPIETILHAKDEQLTHTQVSLKAKVTELGVLELWCVAKDGQKWKLEFDLRKEEEKAQELSFH